MQVYYVKLANGDEKKTYG